MATDPNDERPDYALEADELARAELGADEGKREGAALSPLGQVRQLYDALMSNAIDGERPSVLRDGLARIGGAVLELDDRARQIERNLDRVAGGLERGLEWAAPRSFVEHVAECLTDERREGDMRNAERLEEVRREVAHLDRRTVRHEREIDEHIIAHKQAGPTPTSEALEEARRDAARALEELAFTRAQVRDAQRGIFDRLAQLEEAARPRPATTGIDRDARRQRDDERRAFAVELALACCYAAALAPLRRWYEERHLTEATVAGGVVLSLAPAAWLARRAPTTWHEHERRTIKGFAVAAIPITLWQGALFVRRLLRKGK